jgi:histidinol-phosphatase (PHP family)
MKFDLHTHHERCGHAKGTIRDYIEAALEKGLSVIGISDHSPYFAHELDHPFPNIAMGRLAFASYVEEVLSLQAEYRGRIDVLLGIESDFFPEGVEIYRNYYQSYPFDYIIGSVHFTNGVSIFKKARWEGLSDEQFVSEKETYYDLIRESAKSGLFQIIGHADAIKRYYPAFSDLPSPKVEEAIRVIGECGLAMEVNTSGKASDCQSWYPSDEILEMALHYGVDITFGSDAHQPGRVGDEWEQVARRLKEIGFKEWVYFKQKKRVPVPL